MVPFFVSPYQTVSYAASAEEDAAGASSIEADSDAAEVGADTADTEADAAGASDVSGSGDEAEIVEPDDDVFMSERDAEAADIELTYQGKGYEMTLTGGSEAGLTEDTVLNAREIGSSGKDSDTYDKYISLCESALDTAKDGHSIGFAKFYDITLSDPDGQEIEPSVPVDVSISYTNKAARELAAKDTDNVRIVHISKNENGKFETTVLGTEGDKDNSGIVTVDSRTGDWTEISDAGKGDEPVELTFNDRQLKEVAFTAGSFSVYAVVYTVDFHYGDGTYDFSIAGESSILLSDIFARLHIDDIDMNDIEDVTFSDPTLIKVEEAADADSETAAAASDSDHDWLLTSLKPFDTEETLTVTMNEGSVITITITDAADAITLTWGNNNSFSSSSLKEIIEKYNSNNANGTITFNDDYTVVSEDLIAFKTNNAGRTLTINGNNHTLLRGAGVSGDLIVMSNGTGAFTISNLTIDGNKDVTATGSLIRINVTGNSGAVSLSKVTVKGGNTSGNIIHIDVVNGTRSVPLSIDKCSIELEKCTGNAISMAGALAAASSISIANNSLINGPSTNSTAHLVYVAPSGTAARAIAVTITDSSLYRGQTTGSVIYHSSLGSGATTITSSTISGAKSATDSSSVSATQPLVKQGTGALTITDSTIDKHVASTAGVCAVDASAIATAGNVKVSGSTSITGNAAGGHPANLSVTGTAVLQIPADSSLTGSVGVYSTQSGAGQQFAARGNANTSTGEWNFTNDKDADLVAYLSAPTVISWINSSTFQNDYKYYIKTNNAVTYYSTLETALNAGGNIYCIVTEYTPSAALNITRSTTIQPDPRNASYTIKRGTVTGDLITVKVNGLTLNNIVIDGESKSVAGALIKVNGNYNLTLTDTIIKNHIATDTSCAVEASSVGGNLVVLNTGTQIIGNTANGNPANLRIPSNVANTRIRSSLTKQIGITTTNYTIGSNFARWEGSYSSGWNMLVNDQLPAGTYFVARTSTDTGYTYWASPNDAGTPTQVDDMFGNPNASVTLKTSPSDADMAAVPGGASEGEKNSDLKSPDMLWKSVSFNDDNSVDITLNYFRRQTALDLDFIFVIDESGTMGDNKTANGVTQSQARWARYAAARAAKIALDLNDSYRDYDVHNRVCLLSWDNGNKLSSGFLDNYEQTLQFASSYPALGGGTDHSEALGYTLEAVQESAGQGRTPVVVYLSDFYTSFTSEEVSAGRDAIKEYTDYIYQLLIFENYFNTNGTKSDAANRMANMMPEPYHYYMSDKEDPSTLITPMINIVKDAIAKCNDNTVVNDTLAAGVAEGADVNGITSTGQNTNAATYNAQTNIAQWQLKNDNEADNRLNTGQMYTKVIHIPLTDSVYSGAMPTNGDCVIYDDGVETNKLSVADSPLLQKPLTLIKKTRDTDGAVIEGATFTLSRGANTWNLTTNASGEVSIPWAENDSATGVAFKPGDSYTLTETATANGTVRPGGNWTLTAGSDYKITAITTASAANTNRTNDLAAKLGKFEIYNDIEPTVTYNANGGKFGDDSTEKQDSVGFGNTDTSVEYTVNGSGNFTPTNTNTSLVFVGWNTKADGTGTTYKPGVDTFPVYHGEKDNFITLYAKWAECKALTITNENYGDYANADDHFTVTLILEPGSGQDTLDNDQDERLGWITGGTFSVANGKATVTFNMNGITSGADAANTRTFGMIPVGWTYTVSEAADKGYTVKYKLGTEAESAFAESASGKTGTISADTTVNIRNARETVVPSGVDNVLKASLLFTGLLLAAVLAFLIFTIHRRRLMPRG